MRYSLFSCVILATVLMASAPRNAVADTVNEWNFSNSDLTASYGAATMSLWNSATVGYEDANVNGTTKKVMSYAAFDKTQGLLVNCDATSNYTMIWDLYIPNPSTKYGVLYNTNVSSGVATTQDGTLCLRKLNKDVGATQYEMGTSDIYGGTAGYDAWHRVALTVTALSGGSHSISTYLDGTPGLVNQSYSSSQCPANIASGGFLMFGDDDGETWAGKMSMFYFRDSAMTSSQIAALGGASAAGIAIPEPGVLTVLWTGVVGLLAYAWRKRS